MDEEEEVELIKKKVQAHFDSNILIHAVFKDGVWKNGNIVEISSEFFILNELYEGKMPIFFEQLSRIDTYTKFQRKDR